MGQFVREGEEEGAADKIGDAGRWPGGARLTRWWRQAGTMRLYCWAWMPPLVIGANPDELPYRCLP